MNDKERWDEVLWNGLTDKAIASYKLRLIAKVEERTKLMSKHDTFIEEATLREIRDLIEKTD